jgi:hypothetical protein
MSLDLATPLALDVRPFVLFAAAPQCSLRNCHFLSWHRRAVAPFAMPFD